MAGEGVMGYNQFYDVNENAAGDLTHLRVGDNHNYGSIIVKRSDGMNYDLRPQIVRDLGGIMPKDALTPDQALNAALSLISTGELDRHLSDISDAVAERQKERRDAVMAQVQDIFGPNATVQIPRGAK